VRGKCDNRFYMNISPVPRCFPLTTTTTVERSRGRAWKERWRGECRLSVTKRRKGKRGKKRGEAIRKRDSGIESKGTLGKKKKPDQRNGWGTDAGRRARGGSGRVRSRKSYLLRVSFLCISNFVWFSRLCTCVIYDRISYVHWDKLSFVFSVHVIN